ncbi:hypothetical protein Tco_1313071 [Tanacetum coccineum]
MQQLFKFNICRKIQQEERENILLRIEQSFYMTQLTAHKDSFLQNKVLYERYKKQDQTFVAIRSEEDERAVRRMNEQAADKEKEQKVESVHEEVKEEEGAKKRKLAQEG